MRRQANATIVHEKMKASALTLVKGMSMFLPKNGPTTVMAASTMQASLGAPELASTSANAPGSCPLRPMASMMRLVAP